MSERQSPMHTEDIELDEPGAEAVVGGVAVKHITPEQAFKQGYEAIAVHAQRHADEELQDRKRDHRSRPEVRSRWRRARVPGV